MRSKILKLIAVLAMCFMVIGALVACGEGAEGKAGAKGETGATGTGIASVVLNADGTKFVITYTDGTKAEVAIPSNKCADGCKDVTVHEFKDFEHSATYNEEEEKWEFEDGKFLQVCNVCGASEIIVGVIHNFEVGTKAPTCTEIGFDGKWCLDCPYYESTGNEQAALDHNYVVKDVHDEDRPVCTLGSWQLGVCDRDDCGATKPIYVSAPGHTVETWYKNPAKAPTANKAGELMGTCTECGLPATKEIPALNTTDYAYKLNAAATCVDPGSETWTYTLGEQTFEYPVTLEAKGHIVGGTPVAQLKKHGDAFVYGQAGINILNVTNPECEYEGDGYYVCDVESCKINKSIKVYVDHKWGDAVVTEATCAAGKTTTRECTVEGCDGKDVQEDAATRLKHEYKYELLYLANTQKYFLKTICKNCTTQNSELEVTDSAKLVEVTASRIEPSCKETGEKLMKYTFNGVDVEGATPAEKNVTVKVELSVSTQHNPVIDGVVRLPIAGTTDTYSSEWADAKYEGKGKITVLNNADLSACGATAEGYFKCICGQDRSVNLVTLHDLAYDADHEDNVPTTCINYGKQIWACTKDGCEYTEERIPTKYAAHDYEFELVELGNNLFKVTGTCQVTNCGDHFEYTDLTADDITMVTADRTCTKPETLTITVKKDVDGDGLVDTITLVKETKAPSHKVAADVYVDVYETAVSGVYNYNATYFKALNMTGLVCGVATEFDGYYRCVVCNADYSAKLVADHFYGEFTETKAPTCDELGEKVAYCLCEAPNNKKIEVIPALGHKQLTAKVTLVPTATEPGVLTVTCACGDSYTTAIPALGDFYADYTKTPVEATDCFNPGSIKYAGKYEVAANGYFVEATLDIEFNVVTDPTTHSAPPADLIVYTVEEKDEEGTRYNVTYKVYLCENCGKYIVVDMDAVEIPEEE